MHTPPMHAMHPAMAHFSSGPKRERRQKRLLVFAGVATAALLLALLFVLLVASTPSPTHVSSSSGQQAGSTVARQEQHSLAHYERTAAPMPLLPPYEPACAVSPDQRERAGCPVLACSLAPTCTTRDKRCCAHLHLQMLLFLDRFLASKGLEGEFSLVYGAALGAVRNGTILPSTNDVDIALSPRGLIFLEQNATRAELYSYGYVAWGYKWNRRLCPHSHHPSPEFRSLMLPLDGAGHQSYLEATGVYSPGFIDIWPMWAVPAATRDCEAETVFRSHADVLASALEPLPRQPGSRTTWCITFIREPIVLAAGHRGTVIDGHSFPAPEDPASHFANTYGPSWKQPHTTWHGQSWVTRDGNTVRDALVEWLSLTAWGGMPWALRRQRCAELFGADFDYWPN